MHETDLKDLRHIIIKFIQCVRLQRFHDSCSDMLVRSLATPCIISHYFSDTDAFEACFRCVHVMWCNASQ